MAKLRADLTVSNDLVTFLVIRPLRHDFIATNSGEDLGPETPVYTAKKEHAHSNNWEDVVRVTFCSPRSRRWDEGNDAEEYIGQDVEDSDGEVGVPR